jgi:hypothetical protein
MSKVFVNIGLSLDGYMAPEGMTMENPRYKNWGAKWGALMACGLTPFAPVHGNCTFWTEHIHV